MKRFFRRGLLGLIAGLLMTVTASAQFNVLETENLRLIYYGEMHSFLVPYTARCFENALRFHKALWNFEPSEKITVILHDFSDFGNAGANSIPWDGIAMSIAPNSYAYETVPTNERVNWTLNHELTHIVALDKAAGSDRFFRAIFFGKVQSTSDNPLSIFYGYLTSPRRAAAVWYHEGMAVFLETWMSGGIGRALGSYDEMVFRTMVRDSLRFYDQVGLEAEGNQIDYRLGVNSYLYGTRFHSYLALKYGPEKNIAWVGRSDGSKAYFISQFKEVYGISLDDAWRDWIAWEKQFQGANLDRIREYPTTPYREIAGHSLGAMSRAYLDIDHNLLYAGLSYPGSFPHIAAIDITTGEMKKIRTIKGPSLHYVTSMTFDPVSGGLFYTSDNYDWRDIVKLDPASGDHEMILEDARVGDLAFNHADSSIWGIRHFNALSTIVRIPYPYTEWNQVYSWPYGKDMYDIDVSPDGTLLSGALAEINGRQTLIAMPVDSLLAGDTTYTTLHDFGNSNPAGFVFSTDGRYLYGSSYYTGVSNIFRYDLGLDSMECLSNSETGFFRPIPYSDDSLIVFRYFGDGFRPVMIGIKPIEDVNAITFLGQQVIEAHPELRDWVLPPPSSIDIDSVALYRGPYTSLANVGVASAYPVVEGYKDYPAYGARVNLSTPLAIHSADITASYTPNSLLPDNERFHAQVNYEYAPWKVSFKYNAADFYDLFGPTKVSRKGYSLGLRYHRNFVYDGPKSMDLNVGLTGYGDLERLPDYQNVSASYDKLLAMNVRLSYRHRHFTIGAVEYEKGFTWSLSNTGNYVNGGYYPLFVGTFDFGIPLPIAHSPLWLRHAAGYSPGHRFEPFANFFLGGFGNNYVDYAPEKQYRQWYSFPGVELNEIAGVNFVKSMVEWTLPPLRFRRLGYPALYAKWIRTALFATGVISNLDAEDYRRKVGNLGIQMDLRLQLLSHLRLTVSSGYAVAFEKGRQPTDEFMFSLKVL